MTSAEDDQVPSYERLVRLDGRTIIVLGAGQGIGRQTAHALGSLGSHVVCVDREERRAREVASEVGGDAVVGDVTLRADMDSIVAGVVADRGRLDGIVDIVGLSTWAPLLEIDDAEYQTQLDVCFRHAFLALQIGGRAMVNCGGGGAMVFVSSAAGHYGAPNQAMYGAAKSALMALVRTASVELGPQGIRVNAVSPGVTTTPRLRARVDDAFAAEQVALTPLGRMGRSADVASAILFLMSDLAGHITGQTLLVDGGVAATFPHLPSRRILSTDTHAATSTA